MATEVFVVFTLFLGLVLTIVILRESSKNYRPESRGNNRNATHNSSPYPITHEGKKLGVGIDDGGQPVDVYSGDPYIAPKVFEVGLMKTECRTADACHDNLIYSPAKGNEKAVCNPDALYPITGLSPRYGQVKDCAFSQFIRSA